MIRTTCLLTFFLMASPLAAADAWTASHDRCLIPMSNITPPVLDGLEGAGSRWTDPSGAWDLTLTLDRDELIQCSVTTSAPAPLDGFRTWASDAEAEMTFQALPRTELPDTAVAGLESHEWREPRLHVLAEQKKGLTRFTAEDTALEARSPMTRGNSDA